MVARHKVHHDNLEIRTQTLRYETDDLRNHITLSTPNGTYVPLNKVVEAILDRLGLEICYIPPGKRKVIVQEKQQED